MGIYQQAQNYKRLLDVMPALVDAETGIIESVEEQPRQENMPGLFFYIARSANTSSLMPSGYMATTAGVSTDRTIALCKAVGEAVERYCGSMYDVNQQVLSSFEKLGTAALDPSQLALYSTEQYAAPGFPFVPFKPDTSVCWVMGKSIADQTPLWVPSSLVYVPYQKTNGEAKICFSGSTGLAAHCSYEEAAVNGLLEIIERDCLSITWQARMSRPRIDLYSLTEDHQRVLDMFLSIGYHLDLIDIRNETEIPAVLGVLHQSKNHGLASYVLSAATHLNPHIAIRKCLEELGLMERYTRRAMLTEWNGPGDDFVNVRSYFDHVKLYNNSDFANHASFLTDHEHSIPFHDMPDMETGNARSDFEKLVSILGASGYPPVTVDITTSDIAELGLHVVRSIIPGYHPHLPGFHTRALGGQRLWTIPQQLGYSGIVKDSGDYPFPHPFA